jgi:hypothetical protein
MQAIKTATSDAVHDFWLTGNRQCRRLKHSKGAFCVSSHPSSPAHANAGD